LEIILHLPSKQQNITNYPFCVTTVNKGTQVFLIVEVWGKFKYAADLLNGIHTG